MGSLSKHLCSTQVDTLLKKNDKEGALEVIRNAIRDLVCNRVPVEDLILSKKLSKM